jgi:hypothetical protein
MALISSGEVGVLTTSPFDAAQSKARPKATGSEPLEMPCGLPEATAESMTGSIDGTGGGA